MAWLRAPRGTSHQCRQPRTLLLVLPPGGGERGSAEYFTPPSPMTAHAPRLPGRTCGATRRARIARARCRARPSPQPRLRFRPTPHGILRPDLRPPLAPSADDLLVHPASRAKQVNPRRRRRFAFALRLPKAPAKIKIDSVTPPRRRSPSRPCLLRSIAHASPAGAVGHACSRSAHVDGRRPVINALLLPKWCQRFVPGALFAVQLAEPDVPPQADRREEAAAAPAPGVICALRGIIPVARGGRLRSTTASAVRLRRKALEQPSLRCCRSKKQVAAQHTDDDPGC